MADAYYYGIQESADRSNTVLMTEEINTTVDRTDEAIGIITESVRVQKNNS